MHGLKAWGREGSCPGRAIQKGAGHIKKLLLASGSASVLAVMEYKEGGQEKPREREGTWAG